jgi:Flp pilus assembly pilin Flp
LYSDETGASAVEYGVIIALIIAACFATIVILGNRVEQGYQSFSDALEAQGIS